MSTIHKAVISTRAAVMGLNESSLSSFASGEERIVEAYYKAIDTNSGDDSVGATLDQQKSVVIELVGEMEKRA